MTNLPKIRAQYGEGVGVELFVQFPDLSHHERTFLDADEASGQTALSANGTNFAVDQYIVLGKPGTEKSEIVKLHAATTPTSTAITTAAATAFAHNRGDIIRFIPYNQIIVERSTDAGANYTPLTAVNIRPDSAETYIQRTTDAATDMYRVRFYNSTATTYSAYSDAMTASGYADNTVHSVKNRALDDLGETTNNLITDSWLNSKLWEGRRKLDEDKRVLRWSWRQKFNQDIGNVIPGSWRVAVPTDLRDPNTNKNILAIRIGRDGQRLGYLDAKDFFAFYQDVGHSTIASAITGASTSITLTSSGDFDESGSIMIAGSTVAQTLDTIAYTANNEATNVLSGVTGIADNKAADIDVWQNATFGLPRFFTIFQGYIYFEVPFADEYAGENILMDYYGEIVAYNSDGDVLDEPEVDLYVSWLKWNIKYKKSNGMMENPKADIDYIQWKEGLDSLVEKELDGQYGALIPS